MTVDNISESEDSPGDNLALATLNHLNEKSDIAFGTCFVNTSAGTDSDWLTPDGTTASSSAYGNPYQFTGRRYDPETGLYYYRARHYNTEIGRFLQTDPIGYDDGMNMYAYVGNNPLAWIDPSGLTGYPAKKVHTPFISHAAALLKTRIEDGGQETYRINSATDIVEVLIKAKVTGNRITDLTYIGHGDESGKGIGWRDSEGLTGIYPKSMGVNPSNNVYTFESLEGLMRSSITPTATIELRGCYTLKGNNSIAEQFQRVLPEADIYGYTGVAVIETWFGINWAKRNTSSAFLKYESPKKECK